MSIITTTNIVEAKSISVVDLMQGKNELILIHSKQRYVLRITRNGKLILTK
ncbi:MAG: hemin uptake protein HemP [Oceanospirillaceae bacterium]|nr:hemin uptake protein HemP [Oceanospirillaceae bacterium]